jgi:hypothetical protein
MLFRVWNVRVPEVLWGSRVSGLPARAKFRSFAMRAPAGSTSRAARRAAMVQRDRLMILLLRLSYCTSMVKVL